MPRVKYDDSFLYKSEMNKIGSFKKNIADIIYDFQIIYPRLIKFYDEVDSYAELEKMRSKYNYIKETKITPIHKNRFYIVTNYDYVVLAVIDVDDCIVDNIIGTFNFLSNFQESKPKACFMSYYSSLYVFKGNKLELEYDLAPYKMAQLLLAFKQENIVDFSGVRDHYYGEPRRKSKSNNYL